MPQPITPEQYDPKVAEATTGMTDQPDGLPGFLGVRTTRVGPAP